MKTLFKENEIFRLSAILLAITSCVALILGSVNALTYETIKLNSDNTVLDALASVLPDTKFKEVPFTDDVSGAPSKILSVYKADNGGYAGLVTSTGFGGPINLIVGVDADKKITGIKITEHTETGGLGSLIAEAPYTELFTGKYGTVKSVAHGTGTDDEIVAVSGATVSSDAVVLSVNTFLAYIETLG